VIEDLIEQLNVEVTGERQCFYCDAVVPKGWGEREMDPFPVPKSAGGTATVVSCYACHHMKDRILFEKWPLEWYGVVLGDLQKFEGDTLPFLARAAQAMFRSMGKDDAMLVSQAEQCGIHLGGWPLDWQSRAIVEFPKMRRETRIFLAKVMRLSYAMCWCSLASGIHRDTCRCGGDRHPRSGARLVDRGYLLHAGYVIPSWV
jgi:hypothetical protein